MAEKYQQTPETNQPETAMDALKRVVEMNVAWQSRYAELTKKLIALEQRVSERNSEKQLLEQQIARLNQKVTELEEHRVCHQCIEKQSAATLLQEQNAALVQKVAELERQAVDCNQRCLVHQNLSLTKAVARLELAVDFERQNALEREGELMNDMEVLRTQALVYKEDFDEERRERTELANKIDRLQEELSAVVRSTAAYNPTINPPPYVYCRYVTDAVRAPPRDETDGATEKEPMNTIEPIASAWQQHYTLDEPQAVEPQAPSSPQPSSPQAADTPESAWQQHCATAESDAEPMDTSETVVARYRAAPMPDEISCVFCLRTYAHNQGEEFLNHNCLI